MKNFVDQLLGGFVIAFVVRQVEKFKKEVDWKKVKADYAKRAADLIPGSWFDDEAVKLSNHLIDSAERALGQPKTQEMILKLLADKKYDEAGIKLRDYLLKSWKPDAEKGKNPEWANLDAKAKSALEATKVLKVS